MELKDRLRALREERKLSAAQLAGAFDKSEGAIRMWETGRSKPDADTLIRLAKYFDCTTDYLLGISDIKNEMTRNQNDEFLQEIGKMIGLISNGAENEIMKGAIFGALHAFVTLSFEFDDKSEYFDVKTLAMLAISTTASSLFESTLFIKGNTFNTKPETGYMVLIDQKKNALRGINDFFDAVESISKNKYPQIFEMLEIKKGIGFSENLESLLQRSESLISKEYLDKLKNKPTPDDE